MPSKSQPWPSLDWIVGSILFISTAAVVIWQNARLGVLWDLSYVLETSYRISLGDVPYRDFPNPHAPLTFLIQAAIIRVTGRVFWHHIAYSASMGGLASVMTWRIMLNVLRDTVARPRLVALLLSLPLVVLGIYCVFPHPFYDPDCTLAILLGLLLLQGLDRQKFSRPRVMLVGTALVLPIFFKQNTGLAFIGIVGLALVALLAIELSQRRSISRYAWTIGGAIAAFALALWLIQMTAGLGNYWRWTIRFAAERRTPARAEMLGIYRDKTLLLWLAIFVVGAVLYWFSCRRRRLLALSAALVMSVPFVWPAIYLLRDHDASERADRLLAVWPVLLIIAFVVAILTIKRRRGLSLVLPFILIVTIHGAFMSQQLWGSTYAIWPLFMILLALTISGLASFGSLSSNRLDARLVTRKNGRTSPSSERLNDPRSWTLLVFAAIVAASLLIAGGCYIWSHERLDYSNLTEGEIARSKLPQLKGLSVRGQWLPDFEELVRYSEANIPRDDGLVLIPGEDLFYYTTGRRPRFPILLFDHTTNSYSPEEIIRLCREKNIRWVIVKQELQLEEDPVEDRDRLMQLLEKDYEQVESLGNYDIYRRGSASQEQDQDEDK